MKVQGYQLKFDCQNGEQYSAIGKFWDDMSDLFGREHLYGVGYGWENDTILYMIGHKKDDIRDFTERISREYKDIEYLELDLPDDGWINYKGETDQLSQIYDEIYRQGSLDYEIECFWDDGKCEISVYRYSAK